MGCKGGLLTNTDPAVESHGQARHTVTAEGALCVHTAAIHAHAGSLTLIDVWSRDRDKRVKRDRGWW